jgi:hypothetical protein
MISRECSLLGRREALTGKAKFGIFETEKKCRNYDFKNGDFVSHIIEKTFMMANGELTIEQFFCGLMEILLLSKSQCQQEDKWGHFATHSLNADGSWKLNTTKKHFAYRTECQNCLLGLPKYIDK